MPESLDLATAAGHARVMSSALALGGRIDLWSLLLAVFALAILLWLSLPLGVELCLLLSLLAAAAQKFLALRVALDEKLFSHWAEAWQRAATMADKAASLEADLSMLDQSLAACGLRAPPGETVRDLDSRLSGAGKLLRRQVTVFVLQFLALLLAVLLALCAY